MIDITLAPTKIPFRYLAFVITLHHLVAVWNDHLQSRQVILLGHGKIIRPFNEIYLNLINRKESCFYRDQHWSIGERLIAVYYILRIKWGSKAWRRDGLTQCFLSSEYYNNLQVLFLR